jgi:hypothetical protein
MENNLFNTDDYKDKIPSHLLQALVHWGQKECCTGDFLAAVLSNDLMGAIGRADEHSLAAIRYITMFVYNELPRDCHGSKDRVKQWKIEIANNWKSRADSQ